LHPSRLSNDELVYSLFFPAAFAFFHLAFAAAEIFALAAALILRLPLFTGFAADFRPLTFAQRAFCASAILFLPEALILFRFLGADTLVVSEELKSLLNCFSSDWIFPLRVTARSNCLTVRFVIECIGINKRRKYDKSRQLLRLFFYWRLVCHIHRLDDITCRILIFNHKRFCQME
jgi:hypothetical protein